MDGIKEEIMVARVKEIKKISKTFFPSTLFAFVFLFQIVILEWH